MFKWIKEDGPGFAKLFVDDVYTGKWVYSENAFHYYLSATDSYGYPKPLPAGVEPPPALGPAPTGPIFGDGTSYGPPVDFPADPVPEGSDEMPDAVKAPWTDLLTSKTFWAGVSMILVAVGNAASQYSQGGLQAIDLNTLFLAVSAGVAVIGGRDAIRKLSNAKG